MKKIHVKFVDYFNSTKVENTFIYKILAKHYDVVLSDTPDYLICSVANDEHLKYTNCIKIFWTGENQVPDFNLYDYAIGFHYISFDDRYLRLPLYYLYVNDFELMRQKHQFTQADLDAKEGFCSFVVSNNHASGLRTAFYNQLSKYKPIASGGRYMNNIGGAVADKLEFCKKYKFALAFENSQTPGYTTEKLVQAFAAQAIPIYWGDPCVVSAFNPNAFINCNNYASLDAVIEEIKRLDTDDEAYLRMLQTPALLDANDTIERAIQEVETFLLHIIEQPKEQAIRCDRTYWGRKYQAKLLRRKQSEERSLKGLFERIYRRMFRSVMNGTNKNIVLYRLHRFLMKCANR